MTTQSLNIIVLGHVIRWPLGGMAWSNLHYLAGLIRLGHNVVYVEDSDDYASCYHPEQGITDCDPGYGIQFAAREFRRIGLGDRWAYYDAHTQLWIGPLGERAPLLGAQADVLLNLAAVNPIRPWFQTIPVRAFIDEDPGFTQIRLLTDPAKAALAQQHNVFFSFGENLAAGTARIPDGGIQWNAARQPVVLDLLPNTEPSCKAPITTVMQWSSYRAVTFNGERYGLKSDSFQAFLDLPSLAGGGLLIALGSPDAPRGLLRERGWDLVNPIPISETSESYERFISNSMAEFGIAKDGYVRGWSGWFSERSVCYMAQGRAVLAHETGFSDWMDTSRGGVIPFVTLEDAVDGISAIRAAPVSQGRIARSLAEAYFDYRIVLPALLDRAWECISTLRDDRGARTPNNL